MSDDVESIEIRLLLEAVHARYGYDLRDYAAASMRRRVLAALASSGLPHLAELQHRVLHDRECFSDLLERLTVRVSELFRDPASFHAFRARVVPLLRTYPFLKIWHAGCATGQEAYTSAILLTEEGLYERAQLYATDLSQRALRDAKEAVYPATALPVFEQNHRASGATTDLADHITAAYDHISIRESLRKNILFFHHDLVSDHVFGEMHVVFCKNVLIYFGRELRERVLQKLAQSLRPGGFLCLGTAERLTGATATEKTFTPFSAEARIYRYEP
ncbi:MAG: protein-glutamate O-methyltransferase CheR [Labilithrix sp.]|nr:protein-glutamate O-methyltransferase CheR [Labilithrix sp.]MCW5831908.1 protein-glutamate O-methyltransferase CheR [Labilithrix sp.]